MINTLAKNKISVLNTCCKHIDNVRHFRERYKHAESQGDLCIASCTELWVLYFILSITDMIFIRKKS